MEKEKILKEWLEVYYETEVTEKIKRHDVSPEFFLCGNTEYRVLTKEELYSSIDKYLAKRPALKNEYKIKGAKDFISIFGEEEAFAPYQIEETHTYKEYTIFIIKENYWENWEEVI
jgi:hypothetical protein